jgi:hypothetical protein
MGVELAVEDFGDQMIGDLQQVVVGGLSDCGFGHGGFESLRRGLGTFKFSLTQRSLRTMETNKVGSR